MGLEAQHLLKQAGSTRLVQMGRHLVQKQDGRDALTAPRDELGVRQH